MRAQNGSLSRFCNWIILLHLCKVKVDLPDSSDIFFAIPLLAKHCEEEGSRRSSFLHPPSGVCLRDGLQGIPLQIKKFEALKREWSGKKGCKVFCSFLTLITLLRRVVCVSFPLTFERLNRKR